MGILYILKSRFWIKFKYAYITNNIKKRVTDNKLIISQENILHSYL